MMSEQLNYKLVQIPQTTGSVADIIRDDINGSVIVVASGTIGLHLKVADLVAYVNKIETAKAVTAASPQDNGIDFDKAPVA